MRVKDGVTKVKGVAAGLGRFLRRRKRAAVALLVIAPLPLTGDVEIFALNLAGLGFGGASATAVHAVQGRESGGTSTTDAETTT